MAVKDLENELTSLKIEFTDLKSKIDTLVTKYSNLEKKYEKSLSTKKCASFKCKQCDEECETLSDLKNHKEAHKSCLPFFQCKECDTKFREESQLNEHVKKHTTYPCEECEKLFDYEVTLVKHNEAVHENIKLFCHYWNNDLDCPYEKDDKDQCIFLHEESEKCRFGKTCERNLCMYQHDKDDEEDEDDNGENDDDEEETSTADTLKPVLEKVQDALDKFEIVMQKNSLKCDQCDFEAKNKNGLTMHLKAKHTNKS